MNHGFTKLFSSIVTSTIWAETNPTRIVWITMLALADRQGEVGASIPGLARAANVTIEECEIAIKAFIAPDGYSRTKDHDGRRIIEVEGGWRLLNYAKYREAMRSMDRTEYLRQKQAESRARRKLRESTKTSTLSTESTSLNQIQPIAEAEAEADSKTKRKDAVPALPLVLNTPEFLNAWRDWLQHRKEKKKPVQPGSQTELQQLKTLQDWGVERSIAAIRFTIFKGWDGLREPDENGRKNGHSFAELPLTPPSNLR